MNFKSYLGIFIIAGLAFAFILFLNGDTKNSITSKITNLNSSNSPKIANLKTPNLSIPDFTAEASGNYAAENSVFKVKLPKNSDGKMEIVKEKKLVFTPINAQKSEAKVNGSKITYENVFGSSSVIYQTTGNGIKESIILKSSKNLPNEFSYSFEASDLKAELKDDNSIIFTQISKEPSKDIPVSDGTTLDSKKASNYLEEHPQRFKIPTPIMIDADGKKSGGSDVKVVLNKNILTLIPNKDWLSKAKFPVILDPTVETIPQILQELADQRDYNSKEFLNDDGTHTSVFFQNPIHYQDNQGSFKNIDRTFKDSQDPNYKYQVNTGVYVAKVKKTLTGAGGDILLSFSNTNVGFSPVKISWSDGSVLGNIKNVNGSISQEGSKITYKSIFGISGIDLEAIYDNEKFLKETVINTKDSIQANNHVNDNLEITFNLDIPQDVDLKVNDKIWDKNSTEETEYAITLIKNGKEISDFRKAIAYSQGSTEKAQVIKIRLSKNGNTLTLTKIIPGSWLNSASYPIRTDTTDTIYGIANDGFIESNTGSSYSIARDGTETLIVGTTDGDNIKVGQRDDQCCTYYVWEGFMGFNTSSIGSDSVSSATLSMYLLTDSSGNEFTNQVRLKSWTTGGLTTSDWVAGGSLSASTLLATIDTSGIGSTLSYKTFTSTADFLTNINGSGNTELIINSSKEVNNTIPTQDEYVIWDDADTAGTTQDPKLVVIHAPAASGGVNLGPGININQGTSITTN